jgi:hypothetical protein
LTRTGRIVIALALVAAAVATPAVADDLRVTARVDRTTVPLGQTLTLTITAEGTMRQVPAPSLPPLQAFVVQSSGSSTSMSWVNGQMSASKSWTYTLAPREVGVFTLGSAEIEFGGDVYRTDPIEVEVLESGAAPPAAPSERPSSGVDSGGREIFITTSVDKKRAYVDEQITLSFKFYRRVNLIDRPRYNAPDLTGFWVEDLGDQEEFYEIVDGLQYRVTEIKTALFGAKPGAATIGPATLSYQEGRSGFPFFSGGRPRTLTTRPIEVEIVPLPREGRPAEFKGAVGDFDVSVRLDADNVPALSPVTLRVRIAGTGNVRTVPAPEIVEIPGFKTYESGTSTQITKKNNRVGGVKVYEHVLVPQASGTLTVPGVSFSYFDPASESYQRAASGDLSLTVTPGAPGVDPGAVPVPAAISRIGRDIRYIHEDDGELERARAPIHERAWFVVLQVVPLVGLAGALAVRRRRDRYAEDAGLVGYVRAPRAARRQLADAAARLKSGEHARACSAIARAVTDFIGGRWGVGARGMTMPELTGLLRSAGADEETIERVRRLLSECDLGRFAAGVDRVEGDRLLTEASECLKRLERLSARRRRR